MPDGQLRLVMVLAEFSILDDGDVTFSGASRLSLYYRKIELYLKRSLSGHFVDFIVINIGVHTLWYGSQKIVLGRLSALIGNSLRSSTDSVQ